MSKTNDRRLLRWQFESDRHIDTPRNPYQSRESDSAAAYLREYFDLSDLLVKLQLSDKERPE